MEHSVLVSEVLWRLYDNIPEMVPLNTLLIVEYQYDNKVYLECIRNYTSLVQVQSDMLTLGRRKTYFAFYPRVPN